MYQRPATHPAYLTGWKDIANYLRKGVRTVQRYEIEMGLPIRRLAGKAGGSVMATKTELDAWVAARPIRKEFRLVRPVANTSFASLGQIKQRFLEMRRLRDQMIGLGAEVKDSIQLLKHGIWGLSGEVNKNRLPNTSLPGNSGIRLSNQTRAGLVALERWKRKAN